MNLSHLSIAKRLALVLGSLLALGILSSVFATIQVSNISREVRAMLDEQLKTERLASDWNATILAAVQRTAAIATSTDPALAGYFDAANADAIRRTSALQAQLEPMMNSTAERQLYEEIGAQRAQYLRVRDEVLALKKAGDDAKARQLFDRRFEPETQRYMANVDRLVAMQREELDASAARIDLLGTRTRWMLGIGAVLALALGVLLAVRLSRSITRPLHQAEHMAGTIATMDLRGDSASAYAADETGRLLRALDVMRVSLRNSMGQVREVAESVSSASSQIAVGTVDLSSRTEEAASSLQQTAGAMEQLTSIVRQNADAAQTAGQLARTATEAATEGGEVVRHVVATMGEISADSHRIADIISVIDAIAFQTNILSLNAAVEAARAGEQGRGFAVVAGEVRILAKRSADAAREIKSLINESVEKVQSGVDLVEQAGQVMTRINTSVRRVTDIVQDIAVGSGEQSQGIGEVNTAVVQLDQMTQQNAALVEEASAATDSLKDQAQRLAQVVQGFKLA